MKKRATLYRMVLPDHICPFGVMAKAMLEDNGFEVEDCVLSDRQEVDAFKAERRLDTTPLIIIDGQEIPGASELADYLRSA